MLKKVIKELPALMPNQSNNQHHSSNRTMGKCPGERTFFRLVNAELRKTQDFFEKAQEEFIIREERVREGIAIMEKQKGFVMVNDRWGSMAKSLYHLYKDLLLFETYAIMTYVSFSKILKKHDKVTGYSTRQNFMTHYVNKANFSSYPKVLQLIQSCEKLYEEVSRKLAVEGKENLYEDERLFINMIHRLNKQAMDAAEAEGATHEMSGRKSTSSVSDSSNGVSSVGDELDEHIILAKTNSSSLEEVRDMVNELSATADALSNSTNTGKENKSKLRSFVEENEWNSKSKRKSIDESSASTIYKKQCVDDSKVSC